MQTPDPLLAYNEADCRNFSRLPLLPTGGTMLAQCPPARHLLAALLLSMCLLPVSCAFPRPNGATRSPVLLPDLVIDSVGFGPAYCVNAVVRNIGPGPKPAGAVVTYQFDATYHDPERSRTLTGTDRFLTSYEIPSGWSRETGICDITGEAINAYRVGSIRLTVNPTGTLAELSTLNNSREAAVPHWVGADIEVTGGLLGAGGPGPSDPVVAIVSLKNLGNQRPSGAMPGVLVRIIARGALPGPFQPYEIRYLVYDPLGSEEQRPLRIAVTPPLPVLSQLPPGFFQCVWAIAQLDTVGYSIYIHPPDYAGRFATGGPPPPQDDPGGEGCWSTIQYRYRPPSRD